MPRSSISMASFDGGLFFDINQYLIDNYKMTLPMRKSICSQIYEWIDVEAIENDIDSLVADYAMRKAQFCDIQ